MKAAIHTEYGSADVIRIVEVETPTPTPHDVLIRIVAASVNPLDWHFMRGTPRIGRVVFGIGGPRNPRLGVDVAGTVESVGSAVTRFAPGDAVFGVCKGAFAEFTCARDAKLAPKPVDVSFEEAAGVPIAGLTALQGLRDHACLERGQRVLINGAAGGVGTFAVQIARAMGAHVTGVCSTRNVDLVRSIGADEVIDYTCDDFTMMGRRFDVLFDCVGNRDLAACRRAITPTGAYVGIGGGSPETSSLSMIADGIRTFAHARFARQRLRGFVAKTRSDDLAALADVMAAGAVTTVIDRTFPLADVADAIRLVESGHARGKVIVTIA